MHRLEHSTSRGALRRSVPLALALLLFVGLASAAGESARDWHVGFADKKTVIKAAGSHPLPDGREVYFESFSPLELEPSVTAAYRLEEGEVIFNDTQPAIRPNPNGPPPYLRAEGTISAITWVDETFSDVRMTGEFNTQRADVKSRQGLMARWDNGNNHYWFYVNFATGTYGIVRSRFFGVLMIDLPGSAGPIENFKSTNTYYLEFELRGDVARGRVYEQRPNGRRIPVGDTGDVVDEDPFLAGVSGTLFELWGDPAGEDSLAVESIFVPLHGSYANVTATALEP